MNHDEIKKQISELRNKYGQSDNVDFNWALDTLESVLIELEYDKCPNCSKDMILKDREYVHPISKIKTIAKYYYCEPCNYSLMTSNQIGALDSQLLRLTTEKLEKLEAENAELKLEIETLNARLENVKNFARLK